MYSRPDRPLIVKCTFDKWHKRISFTSARNCTYDILRAKVEQCFSLSATSYVIAYKDDDGEVTNITTNADLTEAIQYFQAGDDAPLSSAASILSGRSFGMRKVTLRVNITVDYDTSLSDTSSMVSIDEFKNRNGSVQSFSLGAPSIVDDDSVTVSSRDNPATGSYAGSSPSLINHEDAFEGSPHSLTNSWSSISQLSKGADGVTANGHRPSPPPSANRDAAQYNNPFTDDQVQSASVRYPEDPSAVFERLKLQEELGDDSSSVNSDSQAVNDRGVAWLRDQNERTIRSMLGALPQPSVSDSMSSLQLPDELGGDLALERDPRGKYYYTYTSASSSASQTHGSGDDDGYNGALHDEGLVDETRPRPTSMHLSWLASQQIVTPERREKLSTSLPILPTHHVDPLSQFEYLNGHKHIDKEFIPFLPMSSPPDDSLTDCSSCGVILDAIRYVCSTCGEKAPRGNAEKGKGKDETNHHYHSSNPFLSSGYSNSSRTYVGSSDSLYDALHQKPLPSLPSSSLTSLSISGRRMNIPNSQPSGYELCSGCLESAGIDHAVESGLAPPGTSPFGGLSPSSDNAQRALQLRRSAPIKGQLRHAFQEKVWGYSGWKDVEQDESRVSQCSTCSACTLRKRYKCASCPKMHLCRACFSQVHELHPSHAFLIVPDKPLRIPVEREYYEDTHLDHAEEKSLTHPGVKCAHCLLDIVGARFHCAECDSVDICSNCESAGLPGNLDSTDGGHNSSHILIKIPYPLENRELQSASRRAVHLWTDRDAATVGFAPTRSRANSEVSYNQTVVGSGSRLPIGHSPDDHRISCNGCSLPIFGNRYQCAHCPSSPLSYNLCNKCEARSHLLHDPMHIFFKLPRPVRRLLQSSGPMLPILYKMPAGTGNTPSHSNDPKAYLHSLVHSAAICDRCMTCILGEWFRCAYCAVDLCDSCEAVDTHDDSHVFMVFKSYIDMQIFKGFANLEDPHGSPPVILYPVYA